MSRVFFVCGNRCVDPYPVYPMGMAVVSAALAARGHEVRQYDLLSAGSDLAALGAAARAYGPDVICYSLRNVDTEDYLNPDDWLLDADRAAIQALREASGAPIVLGGAGFSILPEELLEFLGADYGVVGEGEHAACDLVDALAAGRPWPRLVRSRELMPAARIGCPRYDAAIVPYYQKTSGLVGLQTKRGCPHACAYCSYPLIEGARVRHRDPREVVDDLETLRRDYGVDNVFFTDSIFNDAGGGHLALAEEMLRRGTKIRWASFFRPQRLERAQLEAAQERRPLRARTGHGRGGRHHAGGPGQGLHASTRSSARRRPAPTRNSWLPTTSCSAGRERRRRPPRAGWPT